MKFLEVSDKIYFRRKAWPKGDYAQISNGILSYFDHTAFQWIKDYKLSAEDLVATDWQEEID